MFYLSIAYITLGQEQHVFEGSEDCKDCMDKIYDKFDLIRLCLFVVSMVCKILMFKK